METGRTAAVGMTVDYLEALAREGNCEVFDRVLAKVPDVEPDPWDRWNAPDAGSATKS